MPDDSTLAREDALRARQAADEHQQQVALNRRVHEARAVARAEFEDSDAGAIARQHKEAERIMRLPTPEALHATGSKVGDATKGPAS